MNDQIEEAPDNSNYGSASGTMYGYVAEWRLKPESVALKGFLGKPVSAPEPLWRQAPYKVSDLILGGEVRSVIQPHIPKHDSGRYGMAQYGLIGHRVAVAVIACLRTSIEPYILKHIEWRIVRVRLENSHKMTRDDDNTNEERRRNELDEILGEYLP